MLLANLKGPLPSHSSTEDVQERVAEERIPQGIRRGYLPSVLAVLRLQLLELPEDSMRALVKETFCETKFLCFCGS